MTNALISAVASMQHDLQRMDIISQNMVNSTTPGYKRSVATASAFEAVMRQAEPNPARDSATGAFPAALTSVLDLSPGSVKPTGRNWDLAILGDGYFELSTPSGPAYTRAGDFRLDAEGRLVSSHGYPVQGRSGDVLPGGVEVSIQPDGRLLQGERTVGELKVVRFEAATRLIKDRDGLLRPAAPDIRGTDATPALQVGALENANVTPLREMVDLMETTRHFESAQKLYQGYDDMLGNAVRKLGEF